MSTGGSYPIEDFLEAITAQLDQTQDALRLKAVNRPLTFALKDFNLDLKVFVEMDHEGRVGFRPATPNEEGASTVSIGFTTITRPMVEENTITMEMAQSAGLEELGLQPDERRQLARIGVQNAVQLRNLQRTAGEDTLSRRTGVNLNRIRQALAMVAPQIDGIAAEQPDVVGPLRQPPVQTSPEYKPLAPPVSDPPFAGPPDRMPPAGAGTGLRPGYSNLVGGKHAKTVPVAKGSRRLKLRGKNLLEGGRLPRAVLDGKALSVASAAMNSVTLELPIDIGTGRLRIDFPDGSGDDYDLVHTEPGGVLS